MNYLKSSLIGLSATAALLLGAGIASAQVVGAGAIGYGTSMNSVVIPTDSSQTVTAIGNASSPSLIVSGPIVKATASNGLPMTVIPTLPYTTSAMNSLGYVPATYSGYYGSLATSNYPASNYPVAGTVVYPGAPNTGGPIVNDSAAVSANVNNTGTYIPPSYINSIGGVTGGVSVPAGYSVAFGPYGNLVSTNSNVNGTYGVNGTANGLYSANYAYPGAPNTGGPVGTTGQFYVTGVVSTVTPTALGITSGNQTWTVTWNTGTTVAGTNGINNMTGAQIAVGDMVEVTGYPDQTFVSQIDATQIRDVSVHNI